MSKIYKKDDLLTAEIVDMDAEGMGIGKVDGYTVFVKDSVVGDICLVKIMKAKKNYAYAHLEEIKVPSLFRIEPKCPRAKACGGCQLQAIGYEKQLEFKRDKVFNNLVRIGGFDSEYIKSIEETILGMEEPFRYRNKAQYPVGLNEKTGEIITGFYAGHSHSIIAVEDCVLGPEEYKDIIKIIKEWMKDSQIYPYNYDKKVDGIRHILLRKGFSTNEIMVCLVISKRNVIKDKNVDNLITKLNNYSKNIKSISISVNSENTNVIMGNSYETLWGEDTIEDYIGDLKFKISPLSFFQVNPYQTKRLYEKALEYASLTGGETVWDLYCGIGTISLFLAQKAGHVYGVEIIKEAIDDAKTNAKNNNLTNTTFMVGKAEEVLPEFYNKSSDTEAKSPDVIVVDPPRKGLDEACIETMIKMAPDRIVYVSCDSATLSRDLKLIADGGYKLEKWCACDQFPQTTHVETVVLMSRDKE